MSDIYDIIYVADKSKLIINSPNFTVTLDSTTGKIGGAINFTVTGLSENNGSIERAELYTNQANAGSNGTWENNIYTDTIIVGSPQTTDNTIQSYVFIKPLNEDMIYEYDFIITVAP